MKVSFFIYRQDTHIQEIAIEPELCLNLAATKIQAAFRGYMTRKEYWRQRERYRGLQSQTHSAHYRQDEYSLPSMTSIVDNSSVSALAANADPNVGLTTSLAHVDSSQRNHILRDLKSKLTFSDEMPTASQLQSEHSPTVIILGGINPQKAGDHFLGLELVLPLELLAVGFRFEQDSRGWRN
ncbi:hypothetical protein AVEN_35365-1 [Araneus ventricosus]|uniref:Uncharacterized protein n=1 Tax=Araneus ventricosus TaxID=182803 RepID=A0A4Y2PTH1_ARAVE|nr:hypothetical protein AVEN_35365-1 [Araneus ventricosus]